MFSWFKQKIVNPVAADYVRNTNPKLSRGVAADGLRFVVLDTETSGFNVDKDRILSVAVLEIVRGDMLIERSRSWLVYQSMVKLNDAVTVHGILPSETASGMPEAQVVEELLGILSGAVLVGHHVAFDAAMLDAAMRRHFGIRLRNPIVDTAYLSMIELEAFRQTGYANQRPPTLEEVCAYCGIPTVDRHTAIGDAFTTAELFLLLCARLRRRAERPLVGADLRAQRP